MPHTQSWGSDTNKSTQELIWRDRKTNARGSNPGSSELNYPLGKQWNLTLGSGRARDGAGTFEVHKLWYSNSWPKQQVKRHQKQHIRKYMNIVLWKVEQKNKPKKIKVGEGGGDRTGQCHLSHQTPLPHDFPPRQFTDFNIHIEDTDRCHDMGLANQLFN